MKIRIIEPWIISKLNNTDVFKCKIISNVSDSYTFDFGQEIKYDNSTTFRYLIGKFEDMPNEVNLNNKKIKEVPISLAILTNDKINMINILRYEDMRGYFISGEIST